MSIRVLIAGGGTSGHINPAVAIADSLKRQIPDCEILFCGTEKGLESEIVPKAGYAMETIRAMGVPSRLSVRMIRAFRELYAGRRTCISLIQKFRPDVVVGTGGYVCSPLVSAAIHEKIPYVLHEQNAFPGRSNRLLSGKAYAVCTGFDGMARFFPRAHKVVYTGNPVREAFFHIHREDARKKLLLDDDTFLVLAMGGSLGARTINASIADLSQMLSGYPVHIVLSAGKQQFHGMTDLQRKENDIIEIIEYIFNPEEYMAAADLLICRSGAVTCAEIAALGTPSVMIPYPYAAGDHQTYNAKVFEAEDACKILSDEQVSAETLYQIIQDFLTNRSKLVRMSENARKLARADAVTAITQEVILAAKHEN